jgi:hypothetical protein
MRTKPLIVACLIAALSGGTRTLANAEGVQALKPGKRWVDLTHAVVHVSPSAAPVVKKAGQLLVEETAKRSGVTWKLVTDAPRSGTITISLAEARDVAKIPAGISRLDLPKAANGMLTPEGYLLSVRQDSERQPTVVALGNDASGCMFAVGYLLRNMRLSPGKIEAPQMRIKTTPAKPLRGHQLGFRLQSNSYDRWGVKEFEQYIRDLVIWGTNAIELIPYFPDTDPKVSEDLTVQLADVIHSYGMQVWLWFPFNDKTPDGMTGDGLIPGSTACATRADGRRYLLERRKRLFQRMKHLDAVFMPGGDPGGCECEKCTPWERTFLRIAGETAQIMQQTHPRAKVWLSNQMFSVEENRHFYGFLANERPKWLAGVVYSPWAGHTCQFAREKLPSGYALRMYPDITHALRCQFTIPDMDQAFAFTLDREPPLYRPTQTAHLARTFQPTIDGAITYSDGINDDLNKALWSAYLWNPKEDLDALLADYGRYYIGGNVGDRTPAGLLAIERNMQGPLKANANVERTYALWTALEHDASPAIRKTWRFQMALLRACYDLYVQRKLQADLSTERRVYEALSGRDKAAVQAALSVLGDAEKRPVDPELRTKLLGLGQALYDSIGMQLSVPLWGASGEERGAILDHLDTPLANQPWLRAELTKLLDVSDEAALRAGIDRIVKWEDPGPGGYYDDLGNPLKQPHLVRNKSWAEDPGSMESPRCDFHITYPTGRQSWNNYAETLYDTPLVLQYNDLDPNAQYSVRVTYSGRFNAVMTLAANARHEVHGPIPTTKPPIQQEWAVPREATAGGTLTLTWRRVTGRGSQVSEVWLIKQPAN